MTGEMIHHNPDIYIANLEKFARKNMAPLGIRFAEYRKTDRETIF